MRKFYDTEHDKEITLEELQAEFEDLKASGDTESETFEQYLSNCMTYNNGTLEEIQKGGKHDSKRTKRNTQSI